MEEIWKQIPGYGDYKVSNMGRIKSLKSNKIRMLKTGFNPRGKGYNIIGLYKNKQMYTFRISRLVLSTFIEPCPEGKEASHLNDDSLDDRLENLKWETRTENRLRMIINFVKNTGLSEKEKRSLKLIWKELGKLL